MTHLFLPSHALTQNRDPAGNAIDRLVGDAIRRQRLQCEMTRGQLAQAAKVEHGLIEDFEAGRKRPRAEELQRIAYALRVAPAHFFDPPTLQ